LPQTKPIIFDRKYQGETERAELYFSANPSFKFSVDGRESKSLAITNGPS
jgi:hypothetical protein